MKDSIGQARRQGQSKTLTGDVTYGQSVRNSLGSMFGGIVSGIVNAATTVATTYGGFKAAGPAGAAAGFAIGSTVSEGAKALTSSFFDFRKAKSEGGIGVDSSITKVKQIANVIVSKIDEGTTKLSEAMDKVSYAIDNIELATEGSTSYVVNDIKSQAKQVLEAAKEAQNLAGASKGQISTWMGKI